MANAPTSDPEGGHQVSQLLITDAMLDDVAMVLAQHRKVRKNRCSCGSETPGDRHLAEVMADVIAPVLVAEMMDMLGEIRAKYEDAS